MILLGVHSILGGMAQVKFMYSGASTGTLVLWFERWGDLKGIVTGSTFTESFGYPFNS